MADDLEEAIKAAQKALGEDPAPAPVKAPAAAPQGEKPFIFTEADLKKFLDIGKPPELALESALAREALQHAAHSLRAKAGQGRYKAAVWIDDAGKPIQPPAMPAGFDVRRWRDILSGSLKPSTEDLAREISDARSNVLREEGDAIETPSLGGSLLSEVAGGAGRGMEALFSGAVGVGNAAMEGVQLGAQDLALASVPDELRTLTREKMGPVPAAALRERAFDVAGEALFGEKRAAHMAAQRAQRSEAGGFPVPPKSPEEFIDPTYKGFTLAPFAMEATGGQRLQGESLGGIGALADLASNVGPLALDIATPADLLTEPAIKAGRAVRAFEAARKGASEAASSLIGHAISTSDGIRTITGVLPDGRVIAAGVREPIELVPLSRFKVADDIRDEVLKIQAHGPGALQKADAAVSKLWDKATSGAVRDIGEGISGTLGDIHPALPEKVKYLGRLAIMGRAGAVSEELGAEVNAHSAERRWIHALSTDKASRLKQALMDADEETIEQVTKYLGGERATFPSNLPLEGGAREVMDDIKGVIQDLRAKGQASGTISKETFDEFVNGYLVRVYEQTLERALGAGGKEGERILARMDLPRIRKNGYGAVFDLPEDRLKILIPEEDAKHLVYEPHTVKGRTLVKFEDSAEGSAALDRLLSKTTNDEVAFKFKPLSPEERAALNEVTDPVELVKRTIEKVGRENADAAFLNSVAKNPEFARSRGAAPEGWEEISGSKYGPLNGMYVDPRVRKVLEQKVETDRGVANFVRGLVGAFRANMLFTPRTASRNMMSNFLMYAPLNRVDPLDPKNWRYWGEGGGELIRWMNTGQMSPDIAAMFKGGIEMEPLSAREADFILDIERVGSGVHEGKHSAEVWGKRLMHYATGSPLIDEGSKGATAAARAGTGAVTRGAKAALEGKGAADVLMEAAAAGTANAAVLGPAMEMVQAAYNGGDKWLKIAAFKRWRDLGLEQGLDAIKATQFAVQQTAKFTQNFGEVGGLAGALTGRGQGAGATLMKVVGFPFMPSFWDQHAKILARSMKEQPLETLAMMSRRYALDAAAWGGIVGGGAMTQEQYTRWRRQNPEKVPIAGADGKVYAWDDTYLFPGFPRMGTEGAPQFEGAERTLSHPEGLLRSVLTASPGLQTGAELGGIAKAADTGVTREAESLFTDAPLIRGEQSIPEGAADYMGTRFSNPMSPAYGRDIGRIEDALTKKYRSRLPDEKGEREEQSLALVLADIFGLKFRETSGVRAEAVTSYNLKDQLKDAKASIVDAAKEASNYLSRDERERRLRRAGDIAAERMLKALDGATKEGLALDPEKLGEMKAAIRRDLGVAVEEVLKSLRESSR